MPRINGSVNHRILNEKVSTNGNGKRHNGLADYLHLKQAEHYVEEAQPTEEYPEFRDWRVMARVLQHLQNESEERQAMLKVLGLQDDALSPRLCRKVARNILKMLEDDISSGYQNIMSPEEWRQIRNNCEVATFGYNTIRASEVIPMKVEWLWPGRIPIGNITILSGDPGVGKSWSMLDIMARLTTGTAFPDGSLPMSNGQRRDCLFVTAEDGLADTIRPRFDRLGGDPSRLHLLTAVTEKTNDGRRQVEMALDRHLDMLDGYLHRHELIAAVGLDPMSAFMGKVDTHKDSSVRTAMTPIKKICESRRVAFMGINHLTKGEGNAMYRGMGSIAFNAAARIVWQVSRDREDGERRLFLCVKINLDKEPSGLAFTISPPGRLLWEKGQVTMTADQALAPSQECKVGKVEEAKNYLMDLLSNGPVEAAEGEAALEAAAVKRSAWKKAKEQLNIRSERKDGKWYWLPLQGDGH